MLTASNKKLAQIWAILFVFPLLVWINSYPIWCPHYHNLEKAITPKEVHNPGNYAVARNRIAQVETGNQQTSTEHEYCPDPFREPGLWVSCMFQRTVAKPDTLFLFLAALFAFIAAAFTGFVAFYTKNLWQVTSDLVDDAAQTANVQTALMGQQIDILERQKEVARRQFMAEHRPRLRVRNVVIEHNPNGREAFPFGAEQMLCQCYVENIGGSPATILESHLRIFAATMGLPMESPIEGVSPNNRIRGTLNIGQASLVRFEEQSPLATEGEASRAFGGGHPLYVMGYINYRDHGTSGVVDNVIWRLAFCRQWDRGKIRFVSVNDPDYEYDS